MAKLIIHKYSSTDMLRLVFFTLAILIFCAFEGYSMNHTFFPADTSAKPIAIAIHGGAGTIRRSAMTPEAEAEYRAVLTQALQAGHAVLKRGGTSLDAVSAAIILMEDSPLFNAGKGAVLTADSTIEFPVSRLARISFRVRARIIPFGYPKVAGCKRWTNKRGLFIAYPDNVILL